MIVVVGLAALAVLALVAWAVWPARDVALPDRMSERWIATHVRESR